MGITRMQGARVQGKLFLTALQKSATIQDHEERHVFVELRSWTPCYSRARHAHRAQPHTSAGPGAHGVRASTPHTGCTPGCSDAHISACAGSLERVYAEE